MSWELRSAELAGEIAAGNWSRRVGVVCVDGSADAAVATRTQRATERHRIMPVWLIALPPAPVRRT